MKKKIVFITIVLIVLLTACTSKSDKNNFDNNNDSYLNNIDSMQNKPAIIAGKILNPGIYPNIKEIKLTIPGFRGNEMVFTTEINDSGQFIFEFYPATKREVNLYPIEDVLIIQPGDSLYILKDFKDIGNCTFSGDGAILNQQISKFRSKYLGRYPTDYQKSETDFRVECEKERTKYFQYLIEFQQENLVSDGFNNWATKQIELDFCKALLNYPMQNYVRSKQKLIVSSQYYSFLENLEENFDNSVVLSDYFKITEQFVGYRVLNLKKETLQRIEQKDTLVDYFIEDVFAATTNNYLAQFSLGNYLNISLNSNKTDWVDKYSETINDKIEDPFLKNSLQQHYDRVAEFNNNPKRFSDAILGINNKIEQNNGISIISENPRNIVREIIEASPGKVIYIDFWSTWCPPCIHYMNYSKQLMTNFDEKNVEFVYVCISSKEDLWKEKLSQLKLGGNHIYCDLEETRAIRKRFGFSGVPYYLLTNKKGVIVDFGGHLNPQNEYVKKQIEKLISE